jgi:hypothetical protein
MRTMNRETERVYFDGALARRIEGGRWLREWVEGVESSGGSTMAPRERAATHRGKQKGKRPNRIQGRDSDGLWRWDRATAKGRFGRGGRRDARVKEV